MPLNPQAAAYLNIGATSKPKPLFEMSLEQVRQAYLDMRHLAGEPELVAEIKNLVVPGPVTEIPLRVYYPQTDKPMPVLLYLHGGGFVKGDLDTHDSVCRALANRSECLVVAVHYRLGPESPYPAALDDCFSALQWLTKNGEELLGDGERFAVAGDSAGGWLATQVAIRAREHKNICLATQVLMYPNLDLSMKQSSYERYGTGYLMTTEALRWHIAQYLPPEVDPRNPKVSPLFLKNLNNLPPTVIIGAEYDPLVDEGKLYAERLKDSGVRVTYHFFPGSIHAFFQFGGIMAQGREAIDLVGMELRDAFGIRS
jgi:acetyl esterase